MSIGEEETDVDKKIKDRRKDSKIDSQIIRIQKSIGKVKSEENNEDVNEPEIPEPGRCYFKSRLSPLLSFRSGLNLGKTCFIS